MARRVLRGLRCGLVAALLARAGGNRGVSLYEDGAAGAVSSGGAEAAPCGGDAAERHSARGIGAHSAQSEK